MNTQQAYNNWASQYDTNQNKTRDLEGKALRQILSGIPFNTCLEIGCGTGKNTSWLIEQAKQVTAVDFSEEMLAKAKDKISSANVEFKQADITQPWIFRTQLYDLITFSLVLEHIENLDPIFKEVSQSLNEGGYVYVGELHPFKQYSGTKARFDTEEGRHIVDCYNHNTSDFVRSAKKSGLILTELDEFFDD
ncbi:MAG TPA: class I SAM-dependent methyltransferase, partial [Cyclobacteriaceae bacterium]